MKLSGLEISFVGVRIELTQQVCLAAVPRIPVAMAMTLGHILKTERASSQSYWEGAILCAQNRIKTNPAANQHREHTCDLSPWEVEAGGGGVHLGYIARGQPGLHAIVYQKKTN